MPIILIFSILLSLILSGIAGTGGWFFGWPFWGIFCLAFAGQWIIGGLWNALLTKIYATKLANANAEVNLAESFSNVQVKCEYCNIVNEVKIAINRENKFICVNCKGNNVIAVHLTTARTTTPAPVHDNLRTAFDEIEAERDKIQMAEQSAINTDNIETEKPTTTHKN